MTEESTIHSAEMPRTRVNLLVVAYRNFPRAFLVKGIGLTGTTSIYLYHYLLNAGVESIFSRIGLTVLAVAGIPVCFLYIFTLIRSPRIRNRIEMEERQEALRLHGTQAEMAARKTRQRMESERLENVAVDNQKARTVRESKDTRRWEMLNEWMRLQEVMQSDRSLAEQQTSDFESARDVVRAETASDELLARQTRDDRDDARWAELNETLRVQNATGQVTEDLKEEREAARSVRQTSTDEARDAKVVQEDERWANLTESLRLQHEAGDRSAARESKQDNRDARDAQLLSATALDNASLQRAREKKEDARWALLNETLRVQNATGQVTEDLKEEREAARSVRQTSTDEARDAKVVKEDERWANLTESLRLQHEAGDRSAARDSKQDNRDARDAKLLSDATRDEAGLQEAREKKEDERWAALNERMLAQEKRSEAWEQRTEARELARDAARERARDAARDKVLRNGHDKDDANERATP
jgi:hypothetical protein